MATHVTGLDDVWIVGADGIPAAGNAGTGNVLHSKKQVQTITTSLVWRFNWFH